MTPIPLVSYLRARSLLLAWADSLGDTLDECPLPTTESWVYFAALRGRYIKVGWTRRPEKRPFECWRSFMLSPEMEPVLVIADAGRNVERVVKRAAVPFQLEKPHRLGPLRREEVFVYDSPVLELVGELRCIADASFHPNPRAPLPSIGYRKHCSRCGAVGHNATSCRRARSADSMAA